MLDGDCTHAAPKDARLAGSRPPRGLHLASMLRPQCRRARSSPGGDHKPATSDCESMREAGARVHSFSWGRR
jgi:hypothetical protein